MREVAFELKRLHKTGIILLTLLLAISLSFVNVFYTRSRSSLPRADRTYLAVYPDLASQFYPPSKEMATEGRKVLKNAPGLKAMESLYVQEGTTLFLPPTSIVFSYLFLAAEDDGIVLLEEEEQSLKFGLFFSHYLETHHLEEEGFDSGGALYSLRKRGILLYGMVPLLFFFVLGIWMLGENLERGSHVFQRTLPLGQSKNLLGKILALLLLAALYLLSVFLATTVLSHLLGYGFGRFDYPLRMFGRPDTYITVGAYLVRLFGFFFLRVLFMVNLAFVFASFFRRVSTATLVGGFLLLLFFFFTGYLEVLQSGFNPLYMEYDLLLLGFRTHNLDPASYMILGSKVIPPRLGIFGVLFTGLSPVLFFAMSLALIRGDGINLHQDETESENLLGLPNSFLNFEWKKLQTILSIKSAMSLMLILALSLSIFLHLKDLITTERWVQSERIGLIDEKIEQEEKKLQKLQEEKVNDREIKETQSVINAYKKRLEEMVVLRDSLENKQADLFYTRDQNRIKAHFGYGNVRDLSYGYVHGDFPSNFGYEVSMKRNELLIEKKIDPMLQISVLPTIYDEMKVPADELDFLMKSQPVNHSSLQLLHRAFYYYRFDWVLFVLFVAFCGSGFSTDQQHGLPWIYTLPRKRRQILFDKLKASLLLSFELVTVFLVTLFIYGLVSGGIGQWDYPFLQYLWKVPNPQNGQDFGAYYTFIPLGLALLKMLLILACGTLFLQSFSLFISSFKLKPIPQLAVTLVLIILGYSLSLVSSLQPVVSFLPFSYLDPVSIVSGQKLAKTANGMMSYWMALVVLLLWSMLAYSLTTFRINRKMNIKQSPKTILP